MTNSLEIAGLVLTNIASRFLSACIFYKNIAHLTSTHKRVGLASGREGRYVKKERKKEKVKFNLEQATKTQRGSRSIALLFLEPQR
jgi:hypothetical protein